MINEFRIEGMIYEQPEARKLASGKDVLSLKLKVESSYNGNTQNKIYPIQMLGQKTIAYAQKGKPGDTVCITGVVDSFESKDGRYFNVALKGFQIAFFNQAEEPKYDGRAAAAKDYDVPF